MSAILKTSTSAIGLMQNVSLPTGELSITVHDSAYDIDKLMGFAARANKKRGFLFLSKVLGKHWPVKPKLMGEIHTCLSEKIPGDLDGPVIFIAIAETAVGLGQGTFESYMAANPGREVLFLHTSRYRVGETPIIEFEEPHSHAPRQFLHMPQDVAMWHLFMTAKSLVLIDDEASTGNTFFNLTAACRSLNPLINQVHLATITNFMGNDASQGLSDRFGLHVTIGAILHGEYSFAPGIVQPASGPAQLFEPLANSGASGNFGRLGTQKAMTVPIELVEKLVPQIKAGETVLVLGTGEFMHMAYLLGQDLASCSIDVVVQSTTRSPILQWGAVSYALAFPDNYGEGIANFIYNVQPGQYDHVFIFHETLLNASLCQLAHSLDARLFHFISESQVEEIAIQ